MLKKSASGVLASLRGSTYRSVRLASSLAAALLDSLFEHPAGVSCSCPRCAGYRRSAVPKWFFRSLLDAMDSVKQNRIVPMPNPTTLADGLRTNLGELTLPILSPSAGDGVLCCGRRGNSTGNAIRL